MAVRPLGLGSLMRAVLLIVIALIPAASAAAETMGTADHVSSTASPVQETRPCTDLRRVALLARHRAHHARVRHHHARPARLRHARRLARRATRRAHRCRRAVAASRPARRLVPATTMSKPAPSRPAPSKPKPSPTPTPAPTATPTPVPPAPPAASSSTRTRFGFATGSIQNEDPAMLSRDLDALASTHTAWVRFDINWAQIQGGGPSSYSWAAIDRVASGIVARGMQPLGVIVFTPAWARPAGTTGHHAPDPAQYAAFAHTAVQHYSALGVHAYEVWNEPNIQNFWESPDVGLYTRMLQAAYPAIKGADPSATVLTGGTAPAASNGTNIAPVDFLKGIYANGGKGSFDAVAHHPYCWPALPGDAKDWSAWYQMYGTATSLRSLMVANGDGAKKIWGTEFGAPTNGPAGSYVSEDVQAAALKAAWKLWGSYDWAGPLMWYAGRDLGTATTTRENFFGLLRNDFSAKPAFTALQALTS
jgi:polysaccharide biosynthesis protein PslG